jgi:hypothetical protein
MIIIESVRIARSGGAGGSGPSGPEKLIIELTISGRCRRRPCAADATEGEDAEPGPFRLRLTPSFPSALLAVAEEGLDVEDDEALAERACRKGVSSSECADSMRIRTATGRMMGGARLLCVGQPAGVVLAELPFHDDLEPSRALAPRLS